MMQYQINAGERCIGYTNLENSDVGMGVYGGRFVPTKAYPEVQPVFQLYTQAMAVQPADETLLTKFFIDRDALSFTLWSTDGLLIRTTWILIVDFTSVIPNDDLEVILQVVDIERM